MNFHDQLKFNLYFHCKSERYVSLALGSFRRVKCSPVFVSNVTPLLRANTVQLTRADLYPRAKLIPSVGCSNGLLIGLFRLKLCSDGSKSG